jgi:hypothetical protein
MTLKTKTTIVTQTATTSTLEVTGKLLVELLIAAGHYVPPNAEVYVCVPGGGDWSNTSLDVDTEHPIKVRWKTNVVESKEA